MKKSSKILFVVILLLVFLAGLILYSPRFLLYSTEYKKVQTIILILGPDFTARKKQAYKLADERMADYLIIPAYHKAYRVNHRETKGLSPNLYPFKTNQKNMKAFPSYYEDTHLEIMEAKKMMSVYGLKSAIFVSSPYHMRRIKLIVERVFNPEHGDFYFIPTPYEMAPANFWELSSLDWRKVRREYSKILWFYIYFPFSKID